ncbi:MAG: tRNA adenosine(34) deaminase TadA [Luteitalea sp.]|nr:tRNA adenosine(34) deaminase TadA [Luteitalea sp.]
MLFAKVDRGAVTTLERDERFMHLAMDEARKAADKGEVPIGAVVVLDDEIIGAGHNRPITASDPTAHAEIEALRAAASRIGNYRLTSAELFVTVEPCLMCVGATVHARVARVVFGTREPKAGAARSTMRAFEHPALNHRVEVVEGLLEQEARGLLQEFFRARRPEAPGSVDTAATHRSRNSM